MVKKCIKAIKSAAPDLDDAQAENLLQEITDLIETTKLDTKITDLQSAIDVAVENRVADAKSQAHILKRNAVINLRTRLAFITKLNSTPLEDIPRMIQGILAGEMGEGKYKQSIESTSRGLFSMAKSVFNRNIEDNGVPRNVAIGFLQRKSNGLFLFEEMDRIATKNT